MPFICPKCFCQGPADPDEFTGRECPACHGKLEFTDPAENYALTDRELATVLCGLRLLQETGTSKANRWHHFDEHPRLCSAEIDLLCERLNMGVVHDSGCACAGPVPGALWPLNGSSEVQACDSCKVFDCDSEAAEAVIAGLNSMIEKERADQKSDERGMYCLVMLAGRCLIGLTHLDVVLLPAEKHFDRLRKQLSALSKKD